MLTHLVPAPVGGIMVNGTSIVPDDVDCDSEEIPVVTLDIGELISISWEAVTESHPGEGFPPIMSVDIITYQVVVEVETDTEQELESSVIVSSETTSVEVPTAFTDLDDDGQYKFEILAREESFNQTAVESCFIVM